MRFTFRLLTILCYFLPFTFFLSTCNNGLELRFSYNQKEADSNLIVEQQLTTSTVDTTLNKYDTSIITDQADTTQQANLNDTTQFVSEANNNDDFGDKLFKKVVMPTDKSLSGIGSLFYYKNLTGKIALAISLLVSLILLAAFKFVKLRTRLYLLLTAVFCLLIFIIDSFISSVTLLFGTWLLFLLFTLQIIIALNDRKKAYR